MKEYLLSFCIVANSQQSLGQTELWGACTTCGEDGIGTIYRIVNAEHEVVKVFKRDLNSIKGITGELRTASDGLMYGLTTCLPTIGGGIVIAFDPATGHFDELATLPDSIGSDPGGHLVEHLPGVLLGICRGGGAHDAGSIYAFHISDAIFEKLADLDCAMGCGIADGLTPHPNGRFYGTFGQGGIDGMGGVYSYDPATGTLTTEHTFPNTFVSGPISRLTLADDGALYAVRSSAQGSGGILFRFDPDLVEHSILHDFSVQSGASPAYTLTLGPSNKLYGVTQTVNTAPFAVHGSVFSFDPETEQYATIQTFSSELGKPLCAPAFHGNGHLSVHTAQVSSSPQWTIYPAYVVINPSNGNLTYSGTSSFSDGEQPSPSVDGTLYSIKVSPFPVRGIQRSGASGYMGLSVRFDRATNGATPNTYLIRSSGDKIAGATTEGGRYGRGILFELDPFSLEFDTLMSLPDMGHIGRNELLEIAPGSYLVVMGRSDGGSLLRVDVPTQSFVELFSFDSVPLRYPRSVMVRHDGWVYGTSAGSTVHDEGTLWRFDPISGQFELLHTFAENYWEPNLHGDLNLFPDGAIVGTIRNNEPYPIAGSYIFRYDTQSESYNTGIPLTSTEDHHYSAGFAGMGPNDRWTTKLRNLSSPLSTALLRYNATLNSLQQIATFEGYLAKGRCTVDGDGSVYLIITPTTAPSTPDMDQAKVIVWSPTTQTVSDHLNLVGGSSAYSGLVGGMLSTSFGVGMAEHATRIGMTIHPNPASDNVIITVDPIRDGAWRMSDASGRLVMNGVVRDAQAVVDVSELSNGTYSISVHNSEIGMVSGRVLIAR